MRAWNREDRLDNHCHDMSDVGLQCLWCPARDVATLEVRPALRAPELGTGKAAQPRIGNNTGVNL